MNKYNEAMASVAVSEETENRILNEIRSADPKGARAAMELYLEEEVAPELSAHLGSSELLPLPEGFFLERAGLTLLYPIGRLSTLSDRAGAVRIGRVANKLINDRKLSRVEITLSGSFAQTYKGHGTDRALLAGIMGTTVIRPRSGTPWRLRRNGELTIPS